MFITSQTLVGFTHILKVFCQQLTSLTWFIPLHIDVFEFVLSGQNSTRNSSFLKVSFWRHCGVMVITTAQRHSTKSELRFCEGVFLKNGYPSGFIDSCFKKVIDSVLTESPVKLTVRLFIFPLPFLGDISLQLRSRLRKSFKNILNCCKVQIVFKSQRRFSSQLRFK